MNLFGTNSLGKKVDLINFALDIPFSILSPGQQRAWFAEVRSWEDSRVGTRLYIRPGMVDIHHASVGTHEYRGTTVVQRLLVQQWYHLAQTVGLK